ncbi:MAG: hypothetical protein ACLFSW_03080 [Halobacteriales archaeon]
MPKTCGARWASKKTLSATTAKMGDGIDPDDLPTTVDVLRYGEGEGARYMTVPGDDGTKVVGAHSRDVARGRRRRLAVSVAVAGTVAAVGYYIGEVAVAASAFFVVLAAAAYERFRSDGVPEVVGRNVHADEALDEYEIEGYVDEVFVNDGPEP